VLLRGRFVAPAEPGAEYEDGPPAREGWAALRAVVEAPDGTWIATVIGPAAAVEACKDGVVALVKGARQGLIDAEVEAEAAPAPATDEPPQPPR
jgi:hypothetical protein